LRLGESDGGGVNVSSNDETGTAGPRDAGEDAGASPDIEDRNPRPLPAQYIDPLRA
jgi:hypothetical protein